MAEAIVETEALSRSYARGDGVVDALRDVDLRVQRGWLVALQGPSGSGKTTLLNLIGGLDRPTGGRVLVDGADVTAMTSDGLLKLRRSVVAFVFQTFGLLPVLSAAENVEIPLRLARWHPAERQQRVTDLLATVGLADRAGHRPQELSGGEQQRVAIARALAGDPRLLLADEPTAQLDSTNARVIMTLIKDLVVSRGVTALVATHDPALIEIADHVITLRDGKVA